MIISTYFLFTFIWLGQFFRFNFEKIKRTLWLSLYHIIPLYFNILKYFLTVTKYFSLSVRIWDNSLTTRKIVKHNDFKQIFISIHPNGLNSVHKRSIHFFRYEVQHISYFIVHTIVSLACFKYSWFVSIIFSSSSFLTSKKF